MLGGIWFQVLGPQTEKSPFPNWVRVLMTTAALVVEERSGRSPEDITKFFEHEGFYVVFGPFEDVKFNSYTSTNYDTSSPTFETPGLFGDFVFAFKRQTPETTNSFSLYRLVMFSTQQFDVVRQRPSLYDL